MIAAKSIAIIMYPGIIAHWYCLLIPRAASHLSMILCQLTVLSNKLLEPTAVGVVSSAIAAHAASRRWLSFHR